MCNALKSENAPKAFGGRAPRGPCSAPQTLNWF